MAILNKIICHKDIKAKRKRAFCLLDSLSNSACKVLEHQVFPIDTHMINSFDILTDEDDMVDVDLQYLLLGLSRSAIIEEIPEENKFRMDRLCSLVSNRLRDNVYHITELYRLRSKMCIDIESLRSEMRYLGKYEAITNKLYKKYCEVGYSVSMAGEIVGCLPMPPITNF